MNAKIHFLGFMVSLLLVCTLNAEAGAWREETPSANTTIYSQGSCRVRLSGEDVTTLVTIKRPGDLGDLTERSDFVYSGKSCKSTGVRAFLTNDIKGMTGIPVLGSTKAIFKKYCSQKGLPKRVHNILRRCGLR